MKNVYVDFCNYIEKKNLLPKGKSCLAAVSGGADSMCMLDLLTKYCSECGIKLAVISIDHGFRAEAKEEVRYVKEYCKSKNVLFVSKSIEPGACERTEEAARIYRYKLIEETAYELGCDVVAIAHNACDRAETMLFNLFRGSGIAGLSGIKSIRDIYIRPILFMEREDIEAYLAENNIKYYTDATNLTDDYSRNKIRHNIIPVAMEINSSSIAHMNEAADNLSLIEDYIDEEVEKVFKTIVYESDRGICVNCEDFNKLHRVIKGGLIRAMICDMTPKLKDITAAHINSIAELGNRENNARVDLPYGIKAYREYNRLRITNQECAKTAEISIVDLEMISFEEPYDITYLDQLFSFRKIELSNKNNTIDIAKDMPRNKYTKWFDYDKMNRYVYLRTRRENDYIIIDKDGHSKTVSRCMIDEKIPESMRDKVVLIANEDDVLWLSGYRESFAYRIGPETKTILEINIPEGKDGRTC